MMNKTLILLFMFSVHRSTFIVPRFGSPLQLLLQLVEKTPVGTLGDELLWGALDHADFVEAQSVEAHRVLRVVLAPLVVRELLHRLEGGVVVVRVALVHEEPGGPLRLAAADVRRLQDGAQRSLGGHRVLPDEVSVPNHYAAE